MKTKRKGNLFENKIYKELRELGECKKSLGSGSSDEPGDIIFLDQYAIECKHRKLMTWNTLHRFYHKLIKEITTKGKDYIPLVIYRENRREIMVFMQLDNLIITLHFDEFIRYVQTKRSIFPTYIP